jgi:hypothetical protein
MMSRSTWAFTRMPCLWLKHDNRQLFCAVAILPTESAAGLPVGPDGSPYEGSVITARALIDTGATTTCISSRLAAQLRIQPIGKVPVQGVSSVSYHNSYLFMVAFPFALPSSAVPADRLPSPGPGEAQGRVHMLQSVIQGCEFNPGNAPFDVLLGMDVVRTGTLVVQGDGSFSFSF